MSKDLIEISPRTMKILKNFTNVCDHIIINPGNAIYTSRQKVVFAWTKVEEEFPHKMGFYNLAEFISILERQDEQKVEFGDKIAIIKSGRSRTRYKYTPTNILGKLFPEFPYPETDVPPESKFLAKVKGKDLVRLKKMGGTMSLDMFQVVSKKGTVIFRVMMSKDPDGNNFELGLAKGVDVSDFTASFELSKFVMMDDDYSLYVIMGKGIFLKGEEVGVNYLITVDVEHSKF